MKALTVPALVELAKDHNVSTEKLTELIRYNSQVYAEESIRRFNRAFAKLQDVLPIIEKNETITFRDGRTGNYAANDEIQEIVGPICRRFGFTLSFSTTYPLGMVKVVGELAHKDGHSKTSEYEARVDLSGGKTDTQGRGSVISYGMRYCTVPLLNLIQRGADNDGQTAITGFDQSSITDPEAQRVFKLAKTAALDNKLESVWAELTPVEREALPVDAFLYVKSLAGYVL